MASHPVPQPVQDDGSQEPRTGARPARALDPGPLRSVFSDLLGRPPLEAEREEWAGRGLDELLEATLGSEPFWRHWWREQLYYFLLVDSFRPETKRVRETPAALAAGRLSVRDALHRAALTPTFDLRNPGADTFVTVVMEQLCGLSVDRQRSALEAGKKAYDGGSTRFLGEAAANQSDVIRIAVQDKRAAGHLIEREYQRLLRHEPPKKQLAADTRTLHKDPRAFLDLLRSWLLSDAYQQRLAQGFPKSNTLYVRSLFVDLLDELPDEDELEAMRTALDGLADPRPLRSVLARMLLDSGRVPLPGKASIADPTDWVSQRFRRLLGREASSEELRTFVTAFHEPACRPRTILYALLSHPDYHLA